MERAKRLRLVCGLMVAIYLAVAALRLATGVAPLVDPLLITTSLHCQPVRCWTDRDPVRLLAPNQRAAVERSAEARAGLASLLTRPGVRSMLAAGESARALPSFLLFLFLALAFRRLAKGEGFGGGAAGWLRRAAVAALVAVLAQPVADTLRMTALSPITTGRQQIFIAFNGGPFLWGLLLAGAVWVAVWALEEARLVAAELAEIV